MQEKKIKILFDTDIGSDIDDAVALAYLLAQPRSDLLGITTVSGDTYTRAKLASVMCKIANKNVPILLGLEGRIDGPCRQPEVPHHPILLNWNHETLFNDESAIDFMAKTIRTYPNEVVLLAVGPRTNVATLFLKHPDIPLLLKSLQIMGGRFIASRKLPISEWNIHCDPAAAHIVYNTLIPLQTSIGLDVTYNVEMDSKQVKERFDHYLLNPINEMSEIWFKKRKKIKFHDPLAAVTIFNESVCSYKKGTVTIQREDNDFDGITIWEENSNGPHRIGSTVNAKSFFESYFRVFQ